MKSIADSASESPPEELKAGFLVLVFCLGLVLLTCFYLPCLAGLEDYAYSDITYYFQPFCHFMAQELKEGRLPLWNPFLYCGMSQIAVPSPGIIYPGTALMVLLPFSAGVAAYMIVHQLIAGIGSFILVRSLGWGNLAALVAGFSVGFCGYMFSLASNSTLVASMAWLPLALYCLRKIEMSFTPGNIFSLCCSSFCVFMLVAAGRPEVWVPCFLIMIAYIFFAPLRSIWQRQNTFKADVSLAALRLLSIALGSFLAMPVILPTLEWAKLSPRSHGMEHKWVFLWSANWFDFLNLLLGYPFGDICALGPEGNPFRNMVVSRRGSLPFLTSTYLGPAVLMLSFLGFADKKWKERWFILCLLLGWSLMALGQYTPFAPLIVKISFLFSAFRYPVKLMIFPALILSFAAARGTHFAFRKEIGKKLLTGAIFLWLSVFVLGAVMILFPQLAGIAKYYPWLKDTVFSMVLMQKAQSMLGRSFVIASAIGFLGCGLYAFYAEGKLKSQLFAISLLAIVVAPLFYFSYQYARHTIPSGFFKQPSPLAEKLKGLAAKEDPLSAKRTLPLYFDPLFAPKWFGKGKGFGFEEEYFQYTRQMLLPNSNVSQGIAESGGYEAAETTEYRKLLRRTYVLSTQNNRFEISEVRTDYPLAIFCQLSSTGFVLTQSRCSDKPPFFMNRLDKNVFELILDDKNMNVRVYRPKYCRDRIYFADKIEAVSSWENFHKSICDSTSLDLTKSTFVEDSSLVSISHSPKNIRRNFELIKDKSDDIEISADVEKPELLVLADHYYPGWDVTVDGKPQQILRVNMFNRAVSLLPGQHKIRFRYRPASLATGLWTAFTVISLEILLLLLALCKSKRDKRNCYNTCVPA